MMIVVEVVVNDGDQWRFPMVDSGQNGDLYGGRSGG